MDQRNQSTESQNIAEDAVGGQFAAIRRVSARLARFVIYNGFHFRLYLIYVLIQTCE